jgi:hypothetical protein
MNVVHKMKSAGRLVRAAFLKARQRREKSPLYTSVHSNLDTAVHIGEAAAWLCRAQDSGVDRGVSYGCDFGEGFLASYPETTGYIICTLLDLARYYDDPTYERRAVEAGEWEADVQMACGAAGNYLNNPEPAVFDTGMVLLGWAAILRKTKSERIRAAAERAARWLVEIQEPNGHWIRGNAHGYANPKSTLYNVKSAWGLAEIGMALDEPKFIGPASRNAEYTLTKQLPNGWFEGCCLTDPVHPLLHTLAYAMQGLMGIGRICGRQDFIDGATRTADALMRLMDVGGFIPGRLARDFSGPSWCCLTGTAQTSIVWSELEARTGDKRYGEAAERANRYLMARHDISSPDPRIRGGMAGSWPVWAEYGRLKILNWAVKFFIDALLARMPARG